MSLLEYHNNIGVGVGLALEKSVGPESLHALV
jgi:hypothetical protein